ncbi:thiamine pyrophosphate-binding protein [Paenibacillus sp. LMG 31461]|uniref:Thiamine pyrophosphate-binding protein n=1 Tax=Paenibacillus plantarum TaxID=2654975 RepID=A0ABX1XHN5_9BACL|nr:thiamine pyrophosphate-binding protein [Paenibacillus plantarum]NOU67946.1 thiamine pyrophosphate-binding protein [Paenibacillus plantarum]
MKCSDYVIDFIQKQGASHVFEMIGGAIAHLLDSIHSREDVQCVSMHHEQAAAFAAEGYARINGRIGVSMATSGPGALNMLTGIGSCYFDSVPCLFITGQVNTYEYKFDKPVRQIGFQETDIVSVVKPLVKYAELVTTADKMRYCLEKAIYMAQSGRPGPVLLDIPMNIQRAEIDPDQLESFWDSEEYRSLQINEGTTCDLIQLNEVMELMAQSSRPLVLVGGGVRAGGAAEELLTFVEATGIPVVNSLMGLDALPAVHPASFGLIGSYGNRYSNLALANCDLVLILGSRLDTRQTGTRPDTFARGARKVHVDIESVELNHKVKADVALSCGVKPFLIEMNKRLEGWEKKDISAWIHNLESYQKSYPTLSPPIELGGIDPNLFMEKLSDLCKEDDIICLDVGQHQMWASQSFRLKKGQRLLNAGGMGAMGFGLPVAIGASMAEPGKRVIVIAGDGGFQVNIQELETIFHLKLPIKIVVMNNNALGMVRQFQDVYFNGRRQSTVTGYSCPNFVRIAEAYGIPAYLIDQAAGAEEVMQHVLAQDGSALVEVKLHQGTLVNPKLVVNRPIEDMSPLLDREELKQRMVIELLEESEDGVE